jgi:hypothetical protein
MNYLQTDSQSSVSDVDYAQEVPIQRASVNEDLLKGHLNIVLVLNYMAFNYRLEGLKQFAASIIRIVTVWKLNAIVQ